MIIRRSRLQNSVHSIAVLSLQASAHKSLVSSTNRRRLNESIALSCLQRIAPGLHLSRSFDDADNDAVILVLRTAYVLKIRDAERFNDSPFFSL